jgi:hypothetical protein
MPCAPGKPAAKLLQLKAAIRAGDWELALRLAARFPRLGVQAAAIQLGHEAYAHPRFYQQLGKDPERLKDDGKRALIEKYGK